VSYQPEERYWTDYLRIAFPVLGLLLLLGLFWFWAMALIDNGDDDNGNNTVAGVQTPAATATATSGGSLGGEPKLNTVEPTSDSESVQSSATEDTGQSEPKPTRTPRSTGDEESPTSASDGVGTYQKGELVVTNGEANLRSDPALDDANVVTVLSEGTELTVTDDSVQADGYIWVPVEDTAEGQEGWVAEDLLNPA